MPKKLKALVFKALDNAYDGGYGAEVLGASPLYVARSLVDYDAFVAEWYGLHANALGGLDAIAELVKTWQMNKRKESKS